MADKHTSETNYLSLKEMVKSYAQSKWLYINRAFGSYCYHSIIDVNLLYQPRNLNCQANLGLWCRLRRRGIQTNIVKIHRT